MTTVDRFPVGELPGGPLQPMPLVGELSEAFWHGGAQGQLRILRCQACGWYVHPPRPVCARCLGRDLMPEAVSGRGTVYSHTVNHQPWYPGQEVPYVVAVIDLPEQPALRLTSDIVGCPPDEVAIGLPVRVVFAPAGDIFIPLFTPEEEA